MAIDRAIDRLTNAVGGGSNPLDYDDFISGNAEKVTFKGELVPPYAFVYKKNLEEVYLPNAIYIGPNSFTEDTLSESIYDKEIIDLFKNLKLKKVYAPKVTNIEAFAFSSSYIQNIELGNELSIIGNFAFDNCERLFKIKLPKSVSYIKANAFTFSGLNNVDLTAFNVEDDVPILEGVFSSIFPYDNLGFKVLFSSQEVLDKFAQNNRWSGGSEYFKVADQNET